MAIYYIVFVFIFLVAISDLKPRNVVLFCLLFVLALFSGLRGPIDRDYVGYYNYFIAISSNISVNVEPSFTILSKIIQVFDLEIIFLFVIYSIIGVSLKFISLTKISNDYIYYSILIYFSHYFLLMEMTQIRAGVAAGFVLLSIIQIEKKNIFLFLIFIISASLFHYSAFIILPLYFLSSSKVPFIYYILIPIGYFLYFMKIDVVSVLGYIHFDFIHLKYVAYKLKAQVEHLNVFNVWQLSRVLFVYVLLIYSNKLLLKNKFAIILLKFYILSCFVLVVFSNIPAFAYRVSDLLGIVEIILVPFIFYLFREKHKLIPQVIVLLIGVSMILFTLVNNHLLKGY